MNIKCSPLYIKYEDGYISPFPCVVSFVYTRYRIELFADYFKKIFQKKIVRCLTITSPFRTQMNRRNHDRDESMDVAMTSGSYRHHCHLLSTQWENIINSLNLSQVATNCLKLHNHLRPFVTICGHMRKKPFISDHENKYARK